MTGYDRAAKKPPIDVQRDRPQALAMLDSIIDGVYYDYSPRWGESELASVRNGSGEEYDTSSPPTAPVCGCCRGRMPLAGGDAGDAGRAECADGGVAEGGHDLWAGAGVDLGRFRLIEAASAAADLQGLGGVREVDPGGDGQDLARGDRQLRSAAGSPAAASGTVTAAPDKEEISDDDSGHDSLPTIN